MAGHMGDENVTLRSVPVLDIWTNDGDTYVVMKGSIPGAYNSYVQLLIA
jgi:ribosomal protein L3